MKTYIRPGAVAWAQLKANLRQLRISLLPFAKFEQLIEFTEGTYILPQVFGNLFTLKVHYVLISSWCAATKTSTVLYESPHLSFAERQKFCYELTEAEWAKIQPKENQ